MFRQSLRCLHAPKFGVMRLQSTAAATASKPLSKALIGGIEKRFALLTEADQKEVVAALNERQTLPWQELTLDEKRAAWYVHYGPYGPRKPVLLADDKVWVVKFVVITLAGTVGLFAFFRLLASPAPRTMSREWQDMSDEYLKSKNANPFSGYSQVQSK